MSSRGYLESEGSILGASFVSREEFSSLMHFYGTARANAAGHLEIGGCDTVALAGEFGTPLYVMDEALIRENCQKYREAFLAENPDGMVLYACKTFLTRGFARLIDEEGLGLDVVSGGELYTALSAGFPATRIYFNGNNKSVRELEEALDARVAGIVVDSLSELELLSTLAAERSQHQRILLRITPGVEAHTHDYIKTGQTDSKFGMGFVGGVAQSAVRRALHDGHLELVGLHCHIGSQIFALESYIAALNAMLDFVVELRQGSGFVPKILDLGGGLGVRYNDADTPADIRTYGNIVRRALTDGAAKRDLPIPALFVEPGRSIVGEAGTTLYRVGAIKDIPGIRRYVAVDGGMTDNPRVALYQAVYEAIAANKATVEPSQVVSIAGKCCESGDMLIWDAELPPLERGDVLAVCTTGAYNYAMSSNYNRLLRPPVVLVRDGRARLLVAAETYADLVRNDLIPAEFAGDFERPAQGPRGVR